MAGPGVAIPSARGEDGACRERSRSRSAGGTRIKARGPTPPSAAKRGITGGSSTDVTCSATGATSTATPTLAPTNGGARGEGRPGAGEDGGPIGRAVAIASEGGLVAPRARYDVRRVGRSKQGGSGLGTGPSRVPSRASFGGPTL